jgi:hypothetical protein
MSDERVVIPYTPREGTGLADTGQRLHSDGETAEGVSYGSGDGGGMDADQERYINAKVDAVRAQNDARFAEVLTRLEHLPSTASLAWIIAGAVVTTVGLILGILAFGGDRFDGGVQVSSASVQQAIDAREIAEQNAEQVEALNGKLDTLLELMRDRVNE